MQQHADHRDVRPITTGRRIDVHDAAVLILATPT
jgi:hypothetical protein